MNMENAITAYILAGGKSQRMGTDKGFLEWKGQSFVANIIAALTPVVGNNIVLISSDERDEQRPSWRNLHGIETYHNQTQSDFECGCSNDFFRIVTVVGQCTFGCLSNDTSAS